MRCRLGCFQGVGPFGENPFFRGWSSPSGTTPQSAGADSSPFRGAMGVAGYNIRCRKPMPPLKGRGGPRSGGEVRPRRQRCGFHWSEQSHLPGPSSSSGTRRATDPKTKPADSTKEYAVGWLLFTHKKSSAFAEHREHFLSAQGPTPV